MASTVKEPILIYKATEDGGLSISGSAYHPDFEPGDLVYFDPGRPHDVQIRPMLDGERPEPEARAYPPGATWVVYKSPTGSQLRSLVSLPAPYRKNIPSNVARAIRRVARVSPSHAYAFELAASGIDPFQASPWADWRPE